MSIRIVIADDHAVVRTGLRSLLEHHPEMQVVGEAADGEQVLRLAESTRPDVAIIDIVMPGLDGIQTTARMLQTNPAIRVAMLSMHTDERFVFAALHAGATAYLCKQTVDCYIIPAIQSIVSGRRFLSPEIEDDIGAETMRALEDGHVQDSFDLITDREKDVLRLLARGKSNREVGCALGVSVHTVETHRRHLMQKLNLHCTANIVRYAVRKKLVS